MSKYRVTRTRDGLEPEWPFFVLGASDPAAIEAMAGYVAACRRLNYEPTYLQLVEDRAAAMADFARDELLPRRPDDKGTVTLGELAPMDTFAALDGVYEVTADRTDEGVLCYRLTSHGRTAPAKARFAPSTNVWPVVVAASAAKSVVEVTADRRGTRFYIVATRCQNGVMLAVPDFKWSLTFSTHAPPSADYIRRSGFKNKVDAESLAELLHELVWPRLGLARVAR